MANEIQKMCFNEMASASLTNSATQAANLDCRGFDYASVLFDFRIEKNTNAVGPTISLLESDDTVVTNFATFDANFERSAEDLVAAKQVLYHVNRRTKKRYLRASVTTATTTNDDVTVTIIGVLSGGFDLPASTSGMVAQTDAVVVLG